MSVSLRENITAVIETCFSETKDEIQEVAINRILELIRNDEANRKTENSSEIPNNCEEQKWTKENCKGCKYNEYPYDSGTCFVRVCINGNKYEPKDEPQFDKDINVRSKTEPKLSEIPTSKCHYEPQTDCQWK